MPSEEREVSAGAPPSSIIVRAAGGMYDLIVETIGQTKGLDVSTAVGSDTDDHISSHRPSVASSMVTILAARGF